MFVLISIFEYIGVNGLWTAERSNTLTKYSLNPSFSDDWQSTSSVIISLRLDYEVITSWCQDLCMVDLILKITDLGGGAIISAFSTK